MDSVAVSSMDICVGQLEPQNYGIYNYRTYCKSGKEFHVAAKVLWFESQRVKLKSEMTQTLKSASFSKVATTDDGMDIYVTDNADVNFGSEYCIITSSRSGDENWLDCTDEKMEDLSANSASLIEAKLINDSYKPIATIENVKIWIYSNARYRVYIK